MNTDGRSDQDLIMDIALGEILEGKLPEGSTVKLGVRDGEFSFD